MKLRVKDIVKIWNNGAASLVAGQEGLMRRIEVFDMMNSLISNHAQGTPAPDHYRICDSK
mgnify:CR=1 FL=1